MLCQSARLSRQSCAWASASRAGSAISLVAEREEGAADRARVGDREAVAFGRGLALPERLDDALAALGERRELLGGGTRRSAAAASLIAGS